jgi:hypothetical protein
MNGRLCCSMPWSRVLSRRCMAICAPATLTNASIASNAGGDLPRDNGWRDGHPRGLGTWHRFPGTRVAGCRRYRSEASCPCPSTFNANYSNAIAPAGTRAIDDPARQASWTAAPAALAHHQARALGGRAVSAACVVAELCALELTPTRGRSDLVLRRAPWSQT